MNRIVYLNGDFMPDNEAKISIFDRAVTFGDAIYDVAGVLDGKLIDFEHHMQRYFNSLKKLAIESFFHIERIICLEPYTSDEKQEFSDPVSLAWRTVGRLFRHLAIEPRIAEWCFRKMNAHGDDVTTTVDMTTDRWLGGFDADDIFKSLQRLTYALYSAPGRRIKA